MRLTSRRWALLFLAGLIAAVGLVACGGDGGDGGDEGGDEAGSSDQPVATVSSKNLPKALAQNRAEANQIIDGSTEALDEKLAELRGHPVVVNQWGSWCPPCRAEFPFFAEVAESHADDVAFLGVDIQDDRGAAEDFLREFPVPYPSIFDQDADAVRSLNWSQVSPTTWFIDERGEVVHQRPGAYPDGEALEADIQAFLLEA
ncbi:MAG: TlpA family protein disulfide reductase [Solirubrobacterales bacterium]